MTDNRLLRKKQFETVIKGLWDKAKGKFAKLDEPNVFTKKNTYTDDILLPSDKPYIGEVYTDTVRGGGSKRIGRRDYTSLSNGNNGFVKSLIIKTSDLVQDGGNPIDISVWAVKKKTEALQDEDIKLIVDNKSTAPKTYNDEWGVCYEVEINQYFKEEVYFVYQLDGNSSDRIIAKKFDANDNRFIYLEDGHQVTSSELNNHSAAYTGIYGIVGDISVREKLSGTIVKSWKDLEYTSENYSFVNLISHKDTKIFRNQGSINGSNGNVVDSADWTRVYFPIEQGKTYYIYNKRCETQTDTAQVLGSSRFTYFNSPDGSVFDNTTRVDASTVRSFTTNIGGNKKVLSISHISNANYIGMSLHNPNNPFDELMIWESSQTPSQLTYIETHIVDTIVIDGNKVKTTFDPQTATTQLQSTKIDDAIRELAKRPSGGGTGNLNSINTQQGTGGNVTISMNNTGDNVTFAVEGQAYGTLTYMTNEQATQIINLFV